MRWSRDLPEPSVCLGAVRGADGDHSRTAHLVAVVMARNQMLGGGVRKAYASKGDDCTLSRFVKVPGAAKPHPKPTQGWLNGTRFDVSTLGRSIFYRRGVKAPDAKPMVSGHSNVKIGRDVRKGKLFRGYWIFTLTLEERATCPRTCFHWDTCYGNNMPFAKRVNHTDSTKLKEAIVSQLIDEMRPRKQATGRGRDTAPRKGILVRLHALGDFYSVEYVQFWERCLDLWPNLAVFGYTAWKLNTDIGSEIARVKAKHGRRFAIRWSDGFGPVDCTVPLTFEKDCPPTAFVCPEQTGKTAACATCGLCWNTDRNVAFLEH